MSYNVTSEAMKGEERKMNDEEKKASEFLAGVDWRDISEIVNQRLKDNELGQEDREDGEYDGEEEEYTLEEFLEDTKGEHPRSRIVFKDGTSLSLQASYSHYCEPRESGLEKYESYEIAGLKEPIEQLRPYCEEYIEEGEPLPTGAVYAYVPVEIVEEIILEHGGIDKEKTLENIEQKTPIQRMIGDIMQKMERGEDFSTELNKAIGLAETLGKEQETAKEGNKELQQIDDEEQHKDEETAAEDSKNEESQTMDLDNMSLEELLAMEKQTDEEIAQTDAEIERLKMVERIKRKIELSEQKEAELQELRQKRDKKSQQLGQNIELQ